MSGLLNGKVVLINGGTQGVGGAAARVHRTTAYPDFAFPQMQQPGLAPPGWQPTFTDYLYLSFTNAISFSAGDVAPLTRWAKLMMMLQSAVSVAAIALVIARAVNIPLPLLSTTL